MKVWKQLKPKSHFDRGFARMWNTERRRPRYPDPLVVEAATLEVDADRWCTRLEEWQDRLAVVNTSRAMIALMEAERRAFPAFVFSPDGTSRQLP